MIEVIAGTNRPGSNTRAIASFLVEQYRGLGVEADLFDLQDLPLEMFTLAAYAERPSELTPLTDRILASRGLHLVVPEYNGSFPGALKYFIDMLPFPQSFIHRPVAFTGLGSGIWGGLRAVEQLQMIFGYRNAHALPERVFISGVHAKIGKSGEVLDEDVIKRLSDQAVAFKGFTDMLRPV